jgi:antitoxin MazE
MQVQKWGNSLAIRLPKALCQAISIEEGNELEFSIEKNTIIIKPKTLSLEDMLKDVTPEMYHAETFNDGTVGKEEW